MSFSEQDTQLLMLVIPNQPDSGLQVLDQKVKSMMRTGSQKVPYGKTANGKPKLATSYICKVCGKEGKWNQIKDHIEDNHMELSVACYYCEKAFATRNGLSHHKKVTMDRFHLRFLHPFPLV